MPKGPLRLFGGKTKLPITGIAFEHDPQKALVGSHASDPAIAARRCCYYCNVVDAPKGLWHAHAL